MYIVYFFHLFFKYTIYTLALKKVEKYLKIRHDRKINGANYFTWIVNDIFNNAKNSKFFTKFWILSSFPHILNQILEKFL